MPTTEQLRNRLSKKLKELFQLDQPDLDFGFYRIMHAKARQVEDFIDKDLLKIMEEAFGHLDDTRKAELQAAYEKAIQTAREFGAPNPEETEPVKKAKAALDAAKDTASSEGEIYDHLHRFFERYYDNGDFISRRYYTRETSGKAAPFAVPYNGEEVKLHWANADQYYIKTAEYFSNFTFDLRKTKEIEALKGSMELGEGDTARLVHFRIVEATEGEHGNVKASEANKRYFIIHAEQPVEVTANGELVVNFEYRPDPEKSGQENTWREKRNTEAVATILAKIDEMAGSDDTLKDYLRLLKTPAPTETDRNRPLLAKYINQYTARNTMDYFIHKDLGAFLRRELDFYIKNEVMHLDDIENADAPAVESYLSKLKVLRTIAGKLIDFLAQLENFQKKLWLKKKFVVETNYCITLDRVPEELYFEIAANEAQHNEWIKLFAIDEIQAVATGKPGYSKPLTVKFLKANDKLVLDTRFFDDIFKARLLASIENFDEQCDGLLINSENFQALNLLQDRYQKQVKCIYIDPPYNAKSSEILYKNSYRDSSWLSLIDSRLGPAKSMQETIGVFIIAIDEVEQEVLGQLLTQHYPQYEKSCIAVNHNPSGQQGDNFSFTHDYAYFIYPKPGRYIGEQLRENKDEWDVRNFRDVTGDESLRTAGANCFYPIFVKDGEVVGFGELSPKDFHPKINEKCDDGVIAVYPIDPEGVERKWRFARNTVESIRSELQVHFLKKRNVFDIKRLKKKFNFKSNWVDARYSANNHGTQLLNQIIPYAPVSYPKSLYTVRDALIAGLNEQKRSTILDYFAGSGTSGHATISLNREDNGQRKYILVEMGDYFHTVLKPRMAKVVYSESWKDGKPTARDTGISHCFKYLRLESYEDTLNNLRFDDDPIRDKALMTNASLKEDYMLHYMLDVETRGSQSVLNIDAFSDPTTYSLRVKKPGSDEYAVKNIDLVETFNYLIGLRVGHVAAPQAFSASFKRLQDPELPEDQHTKLVLDSKIRQDTEGLWWFRKIEGSIPKDPANPNNGHHDKVLIVWRQLTGDLEKDNLVLDEWFQKNRISTRDFEFDTIYVNGSNNLPNLALAEDTWKVRLIEEEFMKRMWDTEAA